MTTLAPPEPALRLRRVGAIVSGARAAMCATAIGVFLAEPASLPWVLAVVSLTNVVFLATRSWMTDTRPPIGLLLINGVTVTLVTAYVVATAASL